MLPLRFSAAAIALATTFAALPARAGIGACGNIDVTADATCQVEVGDVCMGECTPPKLEAACAAKLEVDCEASCNKVPEVSCTGSCTADCETECNLKPTTFDCEGNCTATCEGDCSSKCSSSDNSSECEAQCKATCSGECHGSCTAMPGEADCTGKCDASCEGSCKVDTNLDCQTSCQGKGFAKCQADFQEGSCKIQCQDPKGAVFCDGQFVDNGGNAQKCIDALDAYLKAHVQASVSGTSGCAADGTCEAQGSAKASCHCSTPAQRGGSTSTAFAIAGLLGLVGVARRRRR